MKNCFLLLILPFVVGCSSSKPSAPPTGKLKITFVQMNDVYEISAMEGGKTGGMARVAHISNQLKQQQPNTFLVMAGDFVSPSIYNSLKVNGERVRGKQMIESMNAAGVDFVTFGNHEFDINEGELQQRINESSFLWIASNTFHRTNQKMQPFYQIKGEQRQPLPEYKIVVLRDRDGLEAKMGLIGITLPFNKADYVGYTDPLATAERIYHQIKDSCDFVVAITHQAMEDDIILAERLPQLAMIMGGHEHDMRRQLVGDVWITKAHANARTLYIIDMVWDAGNRKLDVRPRLIEVNDKIPDDSLTLTVVHKWDSISNANFQSLGFNAANVLIKTGAPLNGLEADVRSDTTNLTRLVVKAMEFAAPAADVAIVNSGSIRVDDMLRPPITEYDLLRTLPFGGGLVEVDMKGALLKQVLTAGRNNRGIGGFLQYSEKITFAEPNQWMINKAEIADEQVYKVVMSDFLITGGEANMEFLKPENPGVLHVQPAPTAISDPRSDIRLAVIYYLQKNKG